MSSKFLVSFFLVLINLQGWAQQPSNPIANKEATVISGPARFTVLTNKIIRLEWQEDGNFQDQASFVFINRNLPVPHYELQETNDSIIIKTDKLQIHYKKGTEKFNDQNLKITYKLNERWKHWYPSKQKEKDSLNLKGTVRTLDAINGENITLPNGLLSRSGYTLINDSNQPLFDNSNFAWAEARPDNNAIDWYFLGYDHDYKGILHDYTKIAGKIPMPPKFAFGYWWSRYWAYTDEDLKNLVNQFENHTIPLEVLVIDMDWHKTWGHSWVNLQKDQSGEAKGWTGYTWNPTYFPDPESFLNWTEQKGLKTTLNLHPASGIQPYEEPYQRMAKAMGIDPSSKKYIPFDITNKKFAENYMNLVLDPLEKQGIDFWWLDWQQWSTTTIPGVTPTWWLNYVFFTRMERKNKARPLIYHRWGGLGNHRYQIGFSGDVISSWESLAYQPYFTTTASNVGYGYWSHDIGGHINSTHRPELYTRWMQWGAFSPILRTHVGKNTEAERRIWAYDYPYERAMREAIWKRYELIPYIYSMSRKAYETGLSIMRPMYYEFPEKQEAYQAKSQYYFGDELIVHPITKEIAKDSLLTSTKTWLPQGEWINMYTGQRITGDTIFEESFALNEVPVYVKSGAIIPMQSITDVLHKKGEKENRRVLTVFTGNNGKAIWYDDEGNTNSYQQQSFTKTNLIHTEPDEKTVVIEIGRTRGTYKEMPKKVNYEIHLPNSWPLNSVSLNGKTLSKENYTYEGKTLSNIIILPETGLKKKLTVKITFPYSTKDNLLNQMQGNIKRIDQAVKSLQHLVNAPREINNYKSEVWAPQNLIALGQIGRRIELEPQKAHKYLENFHNDLPKVINEIKEIKGQKKYIQQALEVLHTINIKNNHS